MVERPLSRLPSPFPCHPSPSPFVVSSPGTALHLLDFLVVVAYFVFTLGVGLWVARHQRSATDYFLGARDLPAWAILLSIVATETSAVTVISVPGIGARGDLTFLQLAFGYLLGRIGVAVWLLPGYFRGDQETAYARLESRFGVGTRRLTSTVFLVTRFMGDAVRVFASAIPLALVAGWSIPTSIVVMGIVTMVYTWLGGFKAVVWTDVLQLTVYLAGGIGALLVTLSLAGGPDVAFTAAHSAGKLKLINPGIDFTKTYTLLGGILGGALLSAASHGTDHLIVQRLLATRSLRDGRIALVGSGFAVFLQFTLFLSVGIAIWAAGAAPTTGTSDEIFPRFVIEHLPVGLSGLLVAGVLAASMCSHSSAISALASSSTYDLYATWTGERSSERLLAVGKGFTIFWGLALIAGSLPFHFFARSGPPIVIFARVLSGVGGLEWRAPVGRLAWPWYVPIGTGLALLSGVLLSYFPRTSSG